MKTIVGFDSAWVDNPKKPGAICSLQLESNDSNRFVNPRLTSFDGALEFIRHAHAHGALCLIALDQPTIVPNETGCRPVDRVAGSLISWLGGGVQPANRSKLRMFDDAAPIWSFKESLGAIEDPEAARSAQRGLFLVEVFPALALSSFEAAFFGRKLAPRYNPDRTRTFKLEHWRAVLAAVARFASQESFVELGNWVEELAAIGRPRKGDQDRLDAVLCAMIGYSWIEKPRTDNVMIGDLKHGYMITPATADVRLRLTSAAELKGIPIDGKIVRAA